MDMHQAFSILGIGVQSTQDEIRATYLDLVKVWHPDRFQHDPALQAKAQNQLKLINQAYRVLRSTDRNLNGDTCAEKPGHPSTSPQSQYADDSSADSDRTHNGNGPSADDTRKPKSRALQLLVPAAVLLWLLFMFIEMLPVRRTNDVGEENSTSNYAESSLDSEVVRSKITSADSPSLDRLMGGEGKRESDKQPLIQSGTLKPTDDSSVNESSSGIPCDLTPECTGLPKTEKSPETRRFSDLSQAEQGSALAECGRVEMSYSACVAQFRPEKVPDCNKLPCPPPVQR